MYSLENRFANTRSFVGFTKRTLTQLNNAGGLRLIRNKAASDSIVVYGEMTDLAEKQADYLTTVRSVRVAELGQQLFDYRFVVLPADSSGGKPLIPQRLMSDDQQLIHQYANALYSFRASLANYVRMLSYINARIPGLIAFLETRYDLD